MNGVTKCFAGIAHNGHTIQNDHNEYFILDMKLFLSADFSS